MRLIRVTTVLLQSIVFVVSTFSFYICFISYQTASYSYIYLLLALIVFVLLLLTTFFYDKLSRQIKKVIAITSIIAIPIYIFLLTFVSLPIENADYINPLSGIQTAGCKGIKLDAKYFNRDAGVVTVCLGKATEGRLSKSIPF